MNASQAERLCAIIEEEIVNLKLKPGDRLDEVRLAERYGTSRTPVREALRQLSSAGLIVLRPHRGAIVAKLGMRELIELLEVMAELEGACGRAAAKACLKSDFDGIDHALLFCRRNAAKNDFGGYQLANEAFHDAISRASCNSYLIKLTQSVRKRTAAYRRLDLERPHRLKTSLEEHTRIACAIRDGLPDEADRLLRVHVLNTGAEVARLISMVSAMEDGDRVAAGEALYPEPLPPLPILPVQETVPVK
jgi:DNA-binding GntR family transcriptional regulator